MRKIQLIIFLFFTVKVSAQSVWHFGFIAGADEGMSSVKLTSGKKLTAASRWGFEGGGFIELSPGSEDNNFRLQMNLLYSDMNINYPMQSLGIGLREGKINLRQVNIPLSAKLFIIKNLSINAGPSFNFNLKGKYTLGEENASRFVTKLDGNRLKTFQPGIIAGCTYYFKSSYFLDFKYAPLFGRINKEVQGDGSFENLNGNIKWSSVSLSLGIRL